MTPEQDSSRNIPRLFPILIHLNLDGDMGKTGFSRSFCRRFPTVCVCVFSSHLLWTSGFVDVPAGVTQKEGHTGFLIYLPSAVLA